MRLGRIAAVVVSTVIVVVAGWGRGAKKMLPKLGGLSLFQPLIVLAVRPAGGCLVFDERAPKHRIQLGPIRSQNLIPKDQGSCWQGEASSAVAEGDGVLVGFLVESARLLSPGQSSARGESPPLLRKEMAYW